MHRARRRTFAGRLEPDPPVWSAEAEVIAEQDRREVLAAVSRLPVRARYMLLELPTGTQPVKLGSSTC